MLVADALAALGSGSLGLSPSSHLRHRRCSPAWSTKARPARGAACFSHPRWRRRAETASHRTHPLPLLRWLTIASMSVSGLAQRTSVRAEVQHLRPARQHDDAVVDADLLPKPSQRIALESLAD